MVIYVILMVNFKYNFQLFIDGWFICIYLETVILDRDKLKVPKILCWYNSIIIIIIIKNNSVILDSMKFLLKGKTVNNWKEPHTGNNWKNTLWICLQTRADFTHQLDTILCTGLQSKIMLFLSMCVCNILNRLETTVTS